jgi:hypothetical protein
MCEPESVLGILSGMPRTVAGLRKPLAAVAAAVGVCGFVATYAAVIAAAGLVFVVVMGAVIWRMRLPDRMPQATVTTRPRQGVRAISAGQQALAPVCRHPGPVLQVTERPVVNVPVESRP